MKKTILYLLPLAALLCGFAMCSDHGSDGGTYKPPVIPELPPEPGYWASFESKFERYEKGQKHAGQTNAALIQTKWVDTMWINDRTHAQIVVWTNDDPIDDLSYEVSDLKSDGNTISKSNVRLRFGSYILGDQKAIGCSAANRTDAYIADALSMSPITAVTIADPVKIWVTVDTPKNAAPGKYTGTIKVKSGDTVRTMDIEILVANKTLPDVGDWEFHLDLWQFPFQLMQNCTPRATFASSEYFDLVEPFYRMLADAGQKAITTYVKYPVFYGNEESMVKWTKKTDGTWTFDYSRFDAFVEKMMSWGIDGQISAFSPYGWDHNVQYYDEAAGKNEIMKFADSEGAGAFAVGGSEYAAFWSPFLQSFREHLTAKGWFSKTVMYVDELRDPVILGKIIDAIKSDNPAWKIGLASNSIGDVEDRLYDYSTFLGRASKKTTQVRTFYTSCSHQHPNCFVTLENSPAEMSWMGWHAAGAGYNGYLRWAADLWRSGDPASARDTGASAGDASMFYYKNSTTNDNGAVSSIRLELLREGIQDYEKIRILNDPELNLFAGQFDADGNETAFRTLGLKAPYLVSKGQAIIAKISVK